MTFWSIVLTQKILEEVPLILVLSEEEFSINHSSMSFLIKKIELAYSITSR